MTKKAPRLIAARLYATDVTFWGRYSLVGGRLRLVQFRIQLGSDGNDTTYLGRRSDVAPSRDGDIGLLALHPTKDWIDEHHWPAEDI